MRIKKKHIREKVDPKAVANQAREVVDAVSKELDSDDKTAQEFVKSMAISENSNAPHVVEFVRELKDETPFIINGVKWMFVMGRYPNNKVDIAVYRFDHDIAYDHDWFMKEVIPKPNSQRNGISEDEFGAASRGIEHGIKPEPSVSDADKKALKIGEPTKKPNIKYGEKDLPFESEIRENKVNRTVIKTIKIKDLK